MIALAHPGLLWTGLGLVSVPILIHFFFRRRHRVVRWAAMEFLLAALKKQKRRMQVENLILLLLRCAVIALLALAIARPAVEAAINPFGGGARAVVLVVDTSASMDARHTGRSALERAKERAGKFLLELDEDSRVTVMVTRDDTAATAPRAVIENAKPAEARSRLAGVRISHGPNELGPVFRLAGEKLAALRGRRMIVFLTDLQHRDWHAPADLAADGEAKSAAGGRIDDLQNALKGLRRAEDEEAPAVVVLDVSSPEASNVVVTDLTLDAGRMAIAGEVLGVSAQLVNHGNDIAHGTVSLFMGRAGEESWRKLDTHTVSIDPSTLGSPQPVAVDFRHTLEPGSEGPARFKVVFEGGGGGGDRLKPDSERYLAARVRPPVRFLPVGEARALNVLRDLAVLDVIEIAEPILPSDLATYDLSRIDVIWWADAEVHLLEEAAVKRMEDFVRRGGGVIFYLGKYAEPGHVNRLLFKERGEGLLPMMLVEERARVDEEHPVLIDIEHAKEVDGKEKHPLFRDTDERPAVFYSPEIVGFVRIKPEFLEDKDFRDRHVIARYTTETGDPAVLEHKLGRGRIVIVTTTPDERWMRVNGSLLPAVIFFNAAHYLVAEDASLRNVLVGRPVRFPLPPTARQVVLEPPAEAGGRTEEPIDDPSQDYVLTQTAFPGFYEVTIRGIAARSATALPTEEVHLAAVNLDPAEGDLRRTSTSEVQRLYQGNNLVFTTEVESVLPRASAGSEDELSRGLLIGVAVLLLLELLLAGSFGTRRRAAA